ncbi:alkaline phosphatase D family protein [Klenkia brasiliensis]|nr:alkaline phosphatase D family protein [Klenkia brasiliensis]
MSTTTHVSRRTVLQGGAAGLAALALGALTPEQARATVEDGARAGVFGFGVASGDPTATSLLLWTRVTPVPGAVPGSGTGPGSRVDWEVAADAGFRRVVRRGTARTDASRDHTVKVVADGLTPYTRYWYRFRTRGATSPVGRTQTSPDEPGRTHALRLAFVSCSNYTGGYFTAYRGIAARDDLDAVLHLGDYLYEYGNAEDRYGPDSLAGTRDHQPPTEMVTLADYRLRHALYKTDPDLQAAHRQHPWITIFDDHEVTNDTYATGAENHQPQEGDFFVRRAAAYQAYLEWMPIREPGWQPAPHRGTQFFRRFSFGDLADLSVVETRQNRSQQVPTTVGGQVNPALADPARHLPEPEQLRWLTDGIRRSRKPWHLVGNQTVFARLFAVPRAGVVGGQVFNADQWDGYQADQATLLQAMAAGSTHPVVLTGDIHSSWANDLPLAPDAVGYLARRSSVGVEFVCPSVTSDGFKESLGGSAAAAVAATTAFQTTNPWIRYLEGIGHGFAVVDVTRERVQTDFWFIRSGGDKGLAVDPRTDPAAVVGFESAWQSVQGSRQVSGPVGQLGPRSDRPRGA